MRLTHATVYVLDQDRAKAFYTEQLGFEVRMDVSMDDFRWLAVGPPEQPDLELVLTEARDPALRELVAKGALAPGVMGTDDCHATYEELSARGVTFLQEPVERPYGIEAVFRDDSGNWYSLNQHVAFDPAAAGMVDHEAGAG